MQRGYWFECKPSSFSEEPHQFEWKEDTLSYITDAQLNVPNVVDVVNVKLLAQNFVLANENITILESETLL